MGKIAIVKRIMIEADSWGDSVDLDRASEADRQGIGGPAHDRTG
jgi:hypothetical protein